MSDVQQVGVVTGKKIREEKFPGEDRIRTHDRWVTTPTC